MELERTRPRGDMRILVRLMKLGLLITTFNYVLEGLFELNLVWAQFVSPPSVPGNAKIVEHFAIQHLLFPCLAILLVFRPSALVSFFSSVLNRYFLVALTIIIFIPEIVVSFWYGDLFKPYPFALGSTILASVQMLTFAGVKINLLQLQHLVFCHLLPTFAFAIIAIAPSRLKLFAGPRTSKGFA